MAGNKGGMKSVEGTGGGRMNPVMVQKYLEGLDYPAGKDEIIEVAQEQEAPQDVLSVLQEIPDKEYESPAELTQELSGSM